MKKAMLPFRSENLVRLKDERPSGGSHLQIRLEELNIKDWGSQKGLKKKRKSSPEDFLEKKYSLRREAEKTMIKGEKILSDETRRPGGVEQGAVEARAESGVPNARVNQVEGAGGDGGASSWRGFEKKQRNRWNGAEAGRAGSGDKRDKKKNGREKSG